MNIDIQDASKPLNLGHSSSDVLLITGQQVHAKSGLRDLIESDHTFYHKGHIPTRSDYLELRQTTENGKPPKLIVGAGGGTAMDIAKYFRHLRSTPLLLVPTTAGSGAECTASAVIYTSGVKSSVPVKRAEYVAYIPELLQSMPDSVMVSSILDMGAQALESIWAQGSTIKSRSFAYRALQVFKFATDALINNEDPRNNLTHLADLQKAAAASGNAINITHTTLAHALSYTLTATYGIEHGYAVWATLPEVTRYNIDKGYAFPDRTRSENALNAKNIAVYLEEVRRLLIPLPIRRKMAHILENIVKQNQTAANKARASNNPVPASNKDITQIVQNATDNLI